MNKRKSLLLSAMIAATLLSLNAAQAASGTVGMTGSVSEPACTMVQGYDANLVIPPIGIQDMLDTAEGGTLSTSEQTDIEVIDCPSSVTVIDIGTVTHDGSPYDANSFIPTGTAKGIRVSVDDAENGYFEVDGSDSSNWFNVDPITGKGTVKIRSSAHRTSSDIVPVAGDYSANVVVNISYR